MHAPPTLARNAVCWIRFRAPALNVHTAESLPLMRTVSASAVCSSSLSQASLAAAPAAPRMSMLRARNALCRRLHKGDAAPRRRAGRRPLGRHFQPGGAAPQYGGLPGIAGTMVRFLAHHLDPTEALIMASMRSIVCTSRGAASHRAGRPPTRELEGGHHLLGARCPWRGLLTRAGQALTCRIRSTYGARRNLHEVPLSLLQPG
jgi:hypothetical protein